MDQGGNSVERWQPVHQWIFSYLYNLLRYRFSQLLMISPSITAPSTYSQAHQYQYYLAPGYEYLLL